MPRYSAVTIIYNPNSTGASKGLAEQLLRQLERAAPGLDVSLTPTSYARHAEELAYEQAMANKRPLIISASGDGGYNEVVNGVMRARRKGSRAITGLLPGGNANDHYRSVHSGNMVQRILRGEAQKIDLLKLTGSHRSAAYERYAHSYIGFGFSAKVGRELTRHQLNRWNEIWIVGRTLWQLTPVRLEYDGVDKMYASFICANVDRMAKYLTINRKSTVDDGQFACSTLAPTSRFGLFCWLLRAAVLGRNDSKQMHSVKLRLSSSTLVQLDGEVIRLDADSDTVISSEPSCLECIV